MNLYDEALTILENIEEDISPFALKMYFYNCLFFNEALKEKHGNDFEMEKIEALIPMGVSSSVSKNLLIAYILSYVFTGKYPDEIYGDLFHTGKSLINENTSEAEKTEIKGNFAKIFRENSHFALQGLSEHLSNAIIFREHSLEGKRYGKKIWIDIVSSEKERESVSFTVDSHINHILGEWELHAVTKMGAVHKKCDDYSKVCTVGDNAWFACSADGVGSSGKSHIGSRLAAETFLELLTKANERFSNPKALKKYISNNLPREASSLWREKLTLEMGEGVDLKNYATTFLFAFGNDDFVACGKVGDGNFFIECSPYFWSHDYYSVEGSKKGSMVYCVSHLLESPELMEIKFYSSKAVKQILITSDGANALRFENKEGVLVPQNQSDKNVESVMEYIRDWEYEKNVWFTRYTCDKFSQSNHYAGGRGDDCTVVYIKK